LDENDWPNINENGWPILDENIQQNTNSNLQRNNKLLTQLLIVGGVAIAVILVAAVIDNYLKDKNFATVRQKPKKNQEEV